MAHQGNVQVLGGATMMEYIESHQTEIALNQDIAHTSSVSTAQIHGMYISGLLPVVQGAGINRQSPAGIVLLRAIGIGDHQLRICHDQGADGQSEDGVQGSILGLNFAGFNVAGGHIKQAIECIAAQNQTHDDHARAQTGSGRYLFQDKRHVKEKQDKGDEESSQ